MLTKHRDVPGLDDAVHHLMDDRAFPRALRAIEQITAAVQIAVLEKEVAEGRSAEDLVGMLATKTPPNAVPNVHHRALIAAELAGTSVTSRCASMAGRPGGLRARMSGRPEGEWELVASDALRGETATRVSQPWTPRTSRQR